MSDDLPAQSDARPDPGLCASCAHAREIASSRGSTFIRCDLSFVDPRFPRYPALPVLACSGYAPPGRPDRAGRPGIS